MVEQQVKALDFIVIGASKSGTTTLFHYLCKHPRIFIPAGKEVPFFNIDEWYDRGWEWFAKEYFSHAPEHSLWGTITPRYMLDIRAPARISKLMPRTKLIALLRNPIDRTYSYYWMRVRTGGERRSFDEIVHEQLDPAHASKARLLPWNDETTGDTYLVRSEYARILRTFLSHFSSEQLLILFTDELSARPQDVLDTFLTFVGLEPGFTPINLGRRYHEGGTNERFPGLLSKAGKISPLRWLWRLLPRQHRDGILLRYKLQLNVSNHKPPVLSMHLRKQLREFYRQDVQDLEAIAGRCVPWKEFYDQ
jgi:hypothetical protein